MATSQDFVNWVCSPDLDSRFLKYVLMAERDSFLRFASGTTHQTIYFPEVKAFNICLPPIGEQRRIADVLQALDDKIELNRCMSQTLESMARALFKSWFVDFDPVGARSAGRDPGLPPELAVLFPNSFRDSAIGGVPTGWLVQTLANTLAVLETGARPLGGISGYTAGIPSIGAESIVGLGVFDYSKTKYVPPEFYARMSNGHVHDRDVLLYKDGGRPGMFEPHLTLFGNGFPFAECAINEHVYRIRAAPDLGQSFLFFWLSSDLAMNEMRIKGTGVAIPGLNSTQVKSLTTLVPAPAVARAFNSLVEPLIDRVLATCTESRRLAQLRETALPELLAPQRVVT